MELPPPSWGSGIVRYLGEAWQLSFPPGFFPLARSAAAVGLYECGKYRGEHLGPPVGEEQHFMRCPDCDMRVMAQVWMGTHATA